MTAEHLPPHLREICSLLAAGLLRLRSRTADEFARDCQNVGGDGESSLHFPGGESVCANPFREVRR
jgi:hypothetical protein